MSVLIILLTFLASVILAFAVSYTSVSLLIASKQKIKPKYHFTGVVNMRGSFDDTLDKTERVSSVDSESAMREWQRRNIQP